MCTEPTFKRRSQSGLTLIELVISIIIISVAIAGVLGVMNLTARKSADPQLRKQAIAVAEALLEEVELMPFTDCDPDGYNAVTAACSQPEALGPEPGETRGSATLPFDNVNDYNGFVLNNGDSDLNNSGTVTVPVGYSAKVVVTPESALGAGNALLISVTVNFYGDSITLEGYRTKYAPTP